VVSIEEIAIPDIPQIRDLMHLTISVCYPAIFPGEVVQFFLDYHSPEEIQRRTQNGLVVALKDVGELRGTGFLMDEEMGGVYIHPDHQRKGYGRQIVEFLLSRAQENKLERIWLDATPLAKPLYDKLGFSLISPMVQMVGDVRLNYFKMEKIVQGAG